MTLNYQKILFIFLPTHIPSIFVIFILFKKPDTSLIDTPIRLPITFFIFCELNYVDWPTFV